MALMRQEPRRDLQSTFSPLLGGDWASGLQPGMFEWPLRGLREQGFPPVEIREDDTHYYVAAELPGYSPEQVDVTIEGDTLTLSGHRDVEEGDAVTYSERLSGRFVRQLTLPKLANGEVSEARMENGLLKIRVQKAEEGRRKRITVQAQ